MSSPAAEGAATSRRSLAAALLATALAALGGPLAGSAAAAPPWSGPALVPNSSDATAPHLIFTPTGEGLATWLTVRSRRLATDGAPVRADRLGPARRLSDRLFFGEPEPAERLGEAAAYGRSRVAVAGVATQPSAGARVARRVGLAFGAIDGRLGRVRILTRRGTGEGPAIAANRAGDIAVAYAERGAVRLVVRRPGRSPGAPLRLARTGRDIDGVARDVDVAVNARGDAVVGWFRSDPRRPLARRRQVYVRLYTAQGRLGRVQALGEVDNSGAISLALSPARRGLAGWTSQALGETAAGPGKQFLNTASPDRRFGRRQTLEAFAASPPPTFGFEPLHGRSIRVAFTPTGRAFVAWTGRTGANTVVRVAEVVGGRAAEPQTLSDPASTASLDHLAVGPRGEALVTWTSSEPGAPTSEARATAYASALAPGAPRFGPAEAVSNPGGAMLASATAEINPATGAAVAAWLQPGPNPPVESGQTVASATRPLIAGP